jgi:DNA-binding CsgD family transcriptional regulator
MPTTEAFYEAAIVPELWGRALDLACSTWGADGGVLSSDVDRLGAFIPSEGVEEFCARFLEGGWEAQDIRSRRGIPLARKGKDIVTDADFVTSEERRRLPLYADFLPSVGFGSFAGTILAESGGAKIVLSLHRKAHRDPFSKAELDRLRHDLTHVRRAARLAAKVRMSYADGLVDSLDRFSCGAILVDWLGRVVRLNARAEAALGDHLQVVASRLRSPQRETNKALQDLIDASIRPLTSPCDPGPCSVLLQRSHDLPLLVQAYPVALSVCDVFQGARGLVLISDPAEDRSLALNALQEIFRLTPAELRVSSALLKGLDTRQIADDHRIGTETVRFHLKSIFAKTGTGHQAQLVSLLSRFVERG